MNSIVGKNIKDRRLELHLSVKEVCAKAGIAKATWYRYENGDIEEISAQKMGRIAKALQTTASDLLGFDANFYEGQNVNSQVQPDPHPASSLTEADLEKIASIVQSSANAEAPRTDEGRIVSFGMDNVPKETRQYLLSVVRAVMAKTPYEKYFADKGESDK